MSSTYFPVNDLLRRKLQTGLIVATLTLNVASTLFLLLFSERIGFGVSVTVDTMTAGLSAVFMQYVLFVAVLLFVVGAFIASFITFLMMKQRTRDFGLIKAIGCPNGLVFGYFMTELLIVTVAGCAIGVFLGFALDFAVTNSSNFQIYQKPPNFWFAFLVFAAFFVLSLVFGTKPILETARLSPSRALSHMQYFGYGTGGKFRPLSRFGLTLRIASRSLFRRSSATIRIVFLLSAVFFLLTVSISGGIIASDTSKYWVEKAIGNNIAVVAHRDMCNQYVMLLSKFFGVEENGNFDYTNNTFLVPEAILEQLREWPEISIIDPRLILIEHVQELSGYKIDPETLTTIPVGGNRTDEVLVVGVDPERAVAHSITEGRSLEAVSEWQVVVGDTVARSMYSPDRSKRIGVSDPLLEGMSIRENDFRIIGVCIDPINNGNVTYVPLNNLQSITGIQGINVVLIKIDDTEDSAIISALKKRVESTNSNFSVFELDETLEKEIAFLQSAWSIIILLPLIALATTTLCLTGFVVLTFDEQRQEFAVLRAVGTNPKAVIAILMIQSLIVLISSFVCGISLGVIATLLILVPNPVVTSFTIAEVAFLLLAALVGMFLSSLYPAMRLAKTPILRIIM